MDKACRRHRKNCFRTWIDISAGVSGITFHLTLCSNGGKRYASPQSSERTRCGGVKRDRVGSVVPSPGLATCQGRHGAVFRFGALHGEHEDRPKKQPVRRRLGDQLPAVFDGEGASELRRNRQRPAGTERKRGSKGIETA